MNRARTERKENKLEKSALKVTVVWNFSDRKFAAEIVACKEDVNITTTAQYKMMMCRKSNTTQPRVSLTVASVLLFASVVLLSLLPEPSAAQPIDMLDQIGSESRRMFYKMLEYLGDYDELEDDGGPQEREENGGSLPLQTSNRVEVAGRDEQCKLPPRRGVCRALLPRFR